MDLYFWLKTVTLSINEKLEKKKKIQKLENKKIRKRTTEAAWLILRYITNI